LVVRTNRRAGSVVRHSSAELFHSVTLSACHQERVVPFVIVISNYDSMANIAGGYMRDLLVP
jgi:hypothetical protein